MSCSVEYFTPCFGEQPVYNYSKLSGKLSFVGKDLIVLTAEVHEIIAGGRTYKVCNSGFSKNINKEQIKGDGFFEGPWDEAGKKIANLLFSKLSAGSIIYLNDAQARLLIKDNSIELQPIKPLEGKAKPN